MDELKKRLKEFLKIKNYSDHTISNYERDINKFLKFIEENKFDAEDLSSPIITLSLIHI